jgi:hypothetical protein
MVHNGPSAEPHSVEVRSPPRRHLLHCEQGPERADPKCSENSEVFPADTSCIAGRDAALNGRGFVTTPFHSGGFIPPLCRSRANPKPSENPEGFCVPIRVAPRKSTPTQKARARRSKLGQSRFGGNRPHENGKLGRFFRSSARKPQKKIRVRPRKSTRGQKVRADFNIRQKPPARNQGFDCGQREGAARRNGSVNAGGN